LRPTSSGLDAVRDVQGFLDVVGDQEAGGAIAREDAQQLVTHTEARQRVEGPERLVHVEQVGLGHEGAGDLDPLEHPSRQFMRVAFLEPGQTHQVHMMCDDLVPLRVRCPVQRELQIPSHGHPREHRAALRDQDPPAARREDRASVDQDFSAVGLLKPGEHVEERRLAAARWPDDGDEFTLTDRERHVLHGQHLTVAGAEALPDPVDRDTSAH
jgi:hypothetical protein